jgi:hypothetical protein
MKELEAELIDDDVLAVPAKKKRSALKRAPSTVPSLRGNGRSKSPNTLSAQMGHLGDKKAIHVKLARDYCSEQDMDPYTATVNDVIAHSILHNALRGSAKHADIWLERTEGKVPSHDPSSGDGASKNITEMLSAIRMGPRG